MQAHFNIPPKKKKIAQSHSLFYLVDGMQFQKITFQSFRSNMAKRYKKRSATRHVFNSIITLQFLVSVFRLYLHFHTELFAAKLPIHIRLSIFLYNNSL
jgi:hypothetical protein